MSTHSNLVGGSTADRLLKCPGSWRATAMMPPSADVPSEYALEGTFAHAVMLTLMQARVAKPKVNLHNLARAMIGTTYEDRALTQAHLDELIEPALDALNSLEKSCGGGFKVLGVEQRVKFPGIPGAFGTVDLILRSRNFVLILDWKFGGGIGVKAVTCDDDGDEWLNPQIAFYACAAFNTFPKLLGKRRLIGAIVQPRSEERCTRTEIGCEELEDFTEDLESAVIAALRPDPPLHRGAHCRFCPAKICCPKWTGAILEAIDAEPAPPANSAAYGEYLSKAKFLVDNLALLKADIDKQLHSFLEAGGTAPGWRLKAKARNRQWREPDVVAPALQGLGFSDDEIWSRKINTFVALDAAARRRGVKIPDELRPTPPSIETTVCRDDDPAPVITREGFKDVLEALQASVRLLDKA